MSSVGSPKKPVNPIGRDIPNKRVMINDINQIPIDYSTTPGGTLFSTTPGGTRIIYDRSFLMKLRNSPMAKSPPRNLPMIPGVTAPVTGKENKPFTNGNRSTATATSAGADNSQTVAAAAPGEPGDEPQFEMDI